MGLVVSHPCARKKAQGWGTGPFKAGGRGRGAGLAEIVFVFVCGRNGRGPVSVATGRAVLERLIAGQLVEAANADRPGSVASVLQSELQKLWKLESVGDVRGLGFLWAVE